MNISALIPNPLNKHSTLVDLAKKSQLIKEGLSFTIILKNIIFLIVLGIILSVYFQISETVVGIVIGTEIFITLIAGYIKIRKVTEIYKTNTQNSAKGYRELLIVSEYWELVKTIFGLVAQCISVALLFAFFYSEISAISIQNVPAYLSIRSESLKYIVFVIVIYRIFEFILKVVRYKLIKNLVQSDDFAVINQDYIVIEKKLQFISNVPGMSLFLILLFFVGIPFVILAVFGGFMLLISFFSIVELKKIKTIQFDHDSIDTSVIRHTIQSYQNEQIAGYVFGILKVATGLKDIFTLYGKSSFGSGKSYFPENTLIVTNCRLLMVQIPVSGGNKIVGQTDYASQNILFNREEIRTKGEEILKFNSLPQILSLAMNDVLFNDIRQVTLNSMKLTIETTKGEKIGYAFMDKENSEYLKGLLQFYLQDRLIVN